MSAEAEARSGVMGDAEREAALAGGEHVRGMPTWPMTPEQVAFTRSIINEGGWRALAWWLRERAAAGRLRFSMQEVPLDALGGSPQRLLDLGLLRLHRYDSGAHQFACNPFTRSWFMAVITTPKEASCPSSPSTPRPEDSTLEPTPSSASAWWNSTGT